MQADACSRKYLYSPEHYYEILRAVLILNPWRRQFTAVLISNNYDDAQFSVAWHPQLDFQLQLCGPAGASTVK